MFYIYAHTDELGKPFYIGKGQGKRAWSSQSRNRHWKNKVNKLGTFKVQIVAANLTEEDAYRFENTIIRAVGLPSLVNLSEGGRGGATGVKMTEETRKKMSEERLSRGSVFKEKMSKSLKVAYSSVQARERISERNKEWHKRPEVKLKVVENAKRLWDSKKEVLLRNANNPIARDKNSDAQKDRKRAAEHFGISYREVTKEIRLKYLEECKNVNSTKTDF